MVQRGASVRYAARQAQRLRAAKIDPLEPRLVRAYVEGFSETRFRYYAGVAGTFDRNAWADVVRECLEAEKKQPGGERGHIKRFAEKAGVSLKTIEFWLKQRVDAKDANVRAVGEAYGYNEADLMIRVGLLDPNQLNRPEIPPEDQWVVDIVEQSGIDPAKKKVLTAMLLEQERADREARARRLKNQIDLLETS